MNFNYKHIIATLLFFLMLSCEKDITVDLPKPDSKVVVEGYIEQNQNPYVVLTKNAPYFDKVDADTFGELFILDAKVTVSNGHEEVPLEIGFHPDRFPYFYYTTNQITGQVGVEYTLKIDLDTLVLKAKTTIPNPVIVDSLKFKNDEPYDTLGYMWFYFTDPDTLGNYYRIFSKTLGRDKDFLHPLSSVADDQLINGQDVEFSTYHPVKEIADTTDNFDETDFYFAIGDTVILKFCSITAEHYYFWKTLEQQSMSGGNPFSSPATIRTNIVGGGLGIWGSYGTYIDTLIIK